MSGRGRHGDEDRLASKPAAMNMTIRPAAVGDYQAVWGIIVPVLRTGETYALPRDISEVDAVTYWTGADRETFVAESEGRVLGTIYLRANQFGGGSHVANCGYVTAAEAWGRGVRRLCARIASNMHGSGASAHAVQLHRLDQRARCGIMAPPWLRDRRPPSERFRPPLVRRRGRTCDVPIVGRPLV
jgi:hypothetical protein